MEEKELLFKNTSRLDKEEISIFQNFALKKTIILSALSVFLICAAFGAIMLVFMQDRFLGIALIASGALGGVAMPLLMKMNIKKQNEEVFKDKRYLNHFEFFEDYINVVSEAAEKDSNEFKEVANEKVEYKNLHQAVIFRTYIFIYINKIQSFVLNQKGMTKGTVAELIEFFKTKNLKVINK